MLAIDGTLLDFKQLDQLALGRTALHRLDARAKILTTLGFVVCVVSFDRYAISALLAFLVYPAVLIALGELPLGYLLRKALIVLPFALVVGMFNPMFDREVLMQLGPLEISGGWVSWASIVIRTLLTAGAALILVAVTGFPTICAALEKLGMPKVFAVQLLFLHRYIFVLTEEAARTARSRQLRTFGRRGLGLWPFGPLLGHLLLRTWERAERIHMAMLARGFSGELHATRHPGRFGWSELRFMGGWIGLFVLLRFCNVPRALGGLLTGVFP